MLKNTAVFIVMFALICMISGCASVSYDIKVNDDLSANVALKVLVDTTFVDMQDVNVKEQMNKIEKEAVKNGYTVTPLKEGSLTGIVATKLVSHVNVVSLSDVLGEEDAGEEPIFHRKRGIIYDTYMMNIPYDGLMGEDNDNIVKGVLSQMKVKFSLEAPTSIQGTNGEHEMKWEFNPNTKNTIEASFKKVNGNRLFIYSVVLLIGLGVWVIIRKRRKQITQFYTPTFRD